LHKGDVRVFFSYRLFLPRHEGIILFNVSRVCI